MIRTVRDLITALEAFPDDMPVLGEAVDGGGPGHAPIEIETIHSPYPSRPYILVAGVGGVWAGFPEIDQPDDPEPRA